MKEHRCTAIVLAAGRGARMNSARQKQYLEIKGYPVLYYSLHAMNASEIIDRIVLVTTKADVTFARKEIVEKFQFQKVCAIVSGGEERQDSVWNGLRFIKGQDEKWQQDYIFIQDGARPVLSEEILQRCYEDVQRYGACVAAVPVKDTIKEANYEGNVVGTPNRNMLWSCQTPQVFDAKLIMKAYEMVEKTGEPITDDAMAVEKMLGHQIHLTKGAYENIKITTPPDLKIAELFLSNVLTGKKTV